MSKTNQEDKYNSYPSLLPLNREIRVSGIKPLTLVLGVLTIVLSYFIFKSFVLACILLLIFIMYTMYMNRKAKKNDFKFLENSFNYKSIPKNLSDEHQILKFLKRK